MKSLALVLTSLLYCSCQSNVDFNEIPIIDTHIHFFDPTLPGGIDWPTPDDKALYKQTIPKTFKPSTSESGVVATVVVEASDHHKDNKWLLDITKTEKKHYTGIVGNLAVGSPMFEKELNELCAYDRFVGLRIRPRKEYPYYTKKFWQDLELLAAKGKTLDILMVGIDLPQVCKIAKRIPTLKIMINHLSGLDLSKPNAVNNKWKKQLAECGAYPNIYMKVSGFFQRSGLKTAPLNLEFYKPCLEHIVTCFSEDRLVYGSNWPVLNRYGNYRDFKSVMMSFCQQYDRQFAEKLLHANAIKFYGLPAIKI